MSALAITNVLGETRVVERSYSGGAYTCPFCAAAVVPELDGPGCRNPCCDAGIYADRERAIENRRRARERGEREEDDRRRRKRAISYARECRERERAEIEEAREAGYCLTCFFRSRHRKRVLHRSPDFHERL